MTLPGRKTAAGTGAGATAGPAATPGAGPAGGSSGDAAAATSARTTDGRRAIGLAAVILLQAVTALFFLGDVVADAWYRGGHGQFHFWLETLATVALAGGVVFLMVELRAVMARLTALDRTTRAARGEMAEVIDTFFAEWGLTPAERDVALMILKGVDNDSIAAMRGTAPGTVRAQATAIYAKAGVDGRAQLFSVFMEELLAGDG